MKLGPLNSQVNAAFQLSAEMHEKCRSIANDVAGYQRDIEQIECSDVDLDTAASSVSALRAKIGVLDKRKAQAEAAHAKQREEISELQGQLGRAVKQQIEDIAAAALADLNTSLEKVLPKFQLVHTTQHLAGRLVTWQHSFDALGGSDFEGLKTLPSAYQLDREAVIKLDAQIRQSV